MADQELASTSYITKAQFDQAIGALTIQFAEMIAALQNEITSLQEARRITIDGPVPVVIMQPDGPLQIQQLAGPASNATIGVAMPGSITIDTTNETATVGFADDHGDPTSAPAGAVATFSSDNTAVATVVADAANPLQADITPVGLGTANIAVTFSGTAIDTNTGQPIADPAPVTVTVSAGAAATESFVLSV